LEDQCLYIIGTIVQRLLDKDSTATTRIWSSIESAIIILKSKENCAVNFSVVDFQPNHLDIKVASLLTQNEFVSEVNYFIRITHCIPNYIKDEFFDNTFVHVFERACVCMYESVHK
jgi:hypothetical protein